MQDRNRMEAGRMLEGCLAGRTRLLNRVITSIFDEALRPVGMRNGQLTLLCMVCYLGRVKPHELQGLLQMDASTISRNVKRLKKLHWLRTQPAEDDRSHYLSLTPKGLRQLEKAIPRWNEAQKRAASLLGESGADSLMRASQGILDAIVQEAPPPRVAQPAPGERSD